MKVFSDCLSAVVFDANGVRYASAQFSDMFARWPWVQEVVASHERCDIEDIDCVETEDGDKITVKGVIVGHYEI
jgi:hypothetical protein